MKQFKIISIPAVLLLLASQILSCRSKTLPELSFHTDKQEEYLNASYELASVFAKGTAELSRPKPIRIEYESGNAPYIFLISENADMSKPLRYETDENYIELYNLKLACTYYYQVSSENNETKSFVISSIGPRNLYVDGVTNVRDLGGWATSDGKRVRQGMMVRSAKLSADETGETLITSNGIKVLLEDIGIRTELDLREVSDNENGGITQSPLGPSVQYISFPLKSGANNINLNKDSLPALFSILGNEDNYPIIFHCSIGTDRTGLVAFLVNGLLGVDEEALFRDYLFSNFGLIGRLRTPSMVEEYITTVKNASGDTLQERIYNYLISVGVSSSDIDTIIRLMKE